jgi:hypothetical protein
VAFASTALTVLPALASLWATALPGTTVRDANIVSSSGELEAVTVGWHPDITESAIVGAFNSDATQFTGSPMEEKYTIHNGITVMNGNADIVAARTRCLVILNTIGASLVADITLGGLVMRAALGAWELRPYQQVSSGASGVGGALATVAFGVDIYAFTTV